MSQETVKKKLVVFTGAGISQESGIKTFRDEDGTWDEYNVDEVATLDGWRRDRQKVLDFYNKRKSELNTVGPNQAHILLAELEQHFDVTIITQNVDDLHERAGSTNILHLHGQLTLMCSSNNKRLTLPYDKDIKIGDKHEDGSQLRPFIVWFGEDVPLIVDAQEIVMKADIFVVVGTSLEVWPANNLVKYTYKADELIIIDKKIKSDLPAMQYFEKIQAPATIGVEKLKEMLINKYIKE